MAVISGLVVDKLVGFNHTGTIASFSLMPVVHSKPIGMMHVPCYPSRMLSLPYNEMLLNASLPQGLVSSAAISFAARSNVKALEHSKQRILSLKPT